MACPQLPRLPGQPGRAGTAFPSRPKLLLLCCLHAGKFICCCFFPESSNAMLMRSDRKVTAQGRGGWVMCPELRSVSPALLCLCWAQPRQGSGDILSCPWGCWRWQPSHSPGHASCETALHGPLFIHYLFFISHPASELMGASDEPE